MTSSLEERQQKQDIPHLKTILDDNSLTFAEKALSAKSVQIIAMVLNSKSSRWLVK
jgi:hypothetical protein